MKKVSRIKTIGIFYREDNSAAKLWAAKIKSWIGKKHPRVKIVEKRPEALIVLGGDGTILEAAGRYQNVKPILVGLNLGHVGFLASVREPAKFFRALEKFFSHQYWVVEKMMLEASVWRNGKSVFSTNSLNDIVVQNPLGMVEIEVGIEDHPLQFIRGTGALVATATGSTAQNLSAHGPIVMPSIECLILTELFDHNIPTPSIVIDQDKSVTLKILNFRKRGVLTIKKTGKPADVLLVSGDSTIFPLNKGDVIKIRRSHRLVKFAELEKNYFFKSLQEKFAFR